jgi:hypothetical protein
VPELLERGPGQVSLAEQRVGQRDEDPHERDAGQLAQQLQGRLPQLAVDGAAQQRQLAEERVVRADRAGGADLGRDRPGGLVVRDRRVQLADQRGPGRPQPVQVPGREAVPAVGRELLDAGELTVHGGEVPVLERRVDQPDVSPQLGERLAGAVGDLARPGGEYPSFSEELRRAKGQVAGVHGVEQRVGVVGALGEREGFGRQVPRPVSRARFRGEDRLPGAQPRAQRGVLGRHGTQGPGAQRVDGRGRGGIAHPGDHQGGRRGEIRAAGVLGQPGR